MGAPAHPVPEVELMVDLPRESSSIDGVMDGSGSDGLVVAQQPALRAGFTDDNADFSDWLSFLSRSKSRAEFKGWMDKLDVSGQRFVRVVGPTGQPVPAAQVSIINPTTDQLVWSGHTYGDGRAPFYPMLQVPGSGVEPAGPTPQGGWLVQAESDGQFVSTRWQGHREELVLSLDVEPVSGPTPVDVCFVIDTTGSMGDEIARIKQTLLSVTEQLRQEEAVDLRYGAVLYRDIGDAYVTKAHAFTADLQGFDEAIQQIQAQGGGDGPESLNQALAVAVGDMSWREGAARVAFVVADAPPHMDYQEQVTYGRASIAALHEGVRIHSVAASGLDDRGSLTYRQVAQLTRGEFIFIEYGSVAAAAADHGVSGSVGSNNLDAIIYDRIHREIIGWGRDPGALSASR